MPPTLMPRRVLLLNWRDPANDWSGGAEVHIWNVFPRAVQLGWDVRAISTRFQGSEREDEIDGIRVHRTGGEYTYNWSVPTKYFALRREFQPGLVIDFMNKLPLCTPLYVREPIVCFVHHLFGDAAPMEFSWPAAKAVQLSESVIPFVYRSTPMLVGSDSVRSDLIAHGISDANISIVPYGVDSIRCTPGQKSPNPSLLYVGRLKHYKRVDHLLRAAASLSQAFPNLTVDIVGRGDREEPLRALAESLGIARRVSFHGYVSEEAKVLLYQRAWVLCLSSVKEGFGLVVPEAGLCETPAIGYDVQGLRDAIVDKVTGRLVADGDEDQFTSTIGDLLGDDKSRQQLGSAARATYLAQTWERTSNETLAYLDRFLEQRAASPSTRSEAAS